MWSEERCEFPRVLVEWNLMISLIRVEYGVPPLARREVSDFLPWGSLWIGRSDGMCVETTEVDAESDLIGSLLRHDDDRVEPII